MEQTVAQDVLPTSTACFVSPIKLLMHISIAAVCDGMNRTDATLQAHQINDGEMSGCTALTHRHEADGEWWLTENNFIYCRESLRKLRRHGDISLQIGTLRFRWREDVRRRAALHFYVRGASTI